MAGRAAALSTRASRGSTELIYRHNLTGYALGNEDAYLIRSTAGLTDRRPIRRTYDAVLAGEEGHWVLERAGRPARV